MESIQETCERYVLADFFDVDPPGFRRVKFPDEYKVTALINVEMIRYDKEITNQEILDYIADILKKLINDKGKEDIKISLCSLEDDNIKYYKNGEVANN